ncbi:MAG: hypothetical protein ACPGLV_03975 [Bacteroidia bacterium]
MKILLAEDSFLITKWLNASIDDSKYQFVNLSTRAELFSRAGDENWDLIISNIRLKDGNLSENDLLDLTKFTSKMAVISGFKPFFNAVKWIEKPLSMRKVEDLLF